MYALYISSGSSVLDASLNGSHVCKTALIYMTVKFQSLDPSHYSSDHVNSINGSYLIMGNQINAPSFLIITLMSVCTYFLHLHLGICFLKKGT